MKKTLFLLGVILFLSACTQQIVEENIPTGCPPYCSGGSTGVVTTITNPAEDSTVYVGDRLPVTLLLEDIGESSVEYGTVCITGLDENSFAGLGGCNCDNYYITLDESDDSNFERTIVDFTPSLVSSEASGSQHLTAYTRYEYTAYGPITLCLTGDPTLETDCSINGNKLKASSSGPLQITSVEEHISTVGENVITLRLSIEAKNPTLKNSAIIDIDAASESSCLISDEDGKVSANVFVILFGESYSCGTMAFEQDTDTATVSCKIENIDTQRLIGGQKEYDGWIRINYGFQEIQSVAFTVVNE